jgi:hypothetical protein
VLPQGPVESPAESDKPSARLEGAVQAYLAQPFHPRIPAAVGQEVLGRVGVYGRLNAHADGLVELRGRYDLALPYRDALGLWQAYVRGRAGPVEVIVGRQFLEWGPAGGPADCLAPMDFGDPLRPERQPSLAARVDVSLGSVRLSAAVRPGWEAGLTPYFADTERAAQSVYLQRNPWSPDTAPGLTPVEPARYQFDVPAFSVANAVFAGRASFDSDFLSVGLGALEGPASFVEIGTRDASEPGVVWHPLPEPVHSFHLDLTMRPGEWTISFMAAAFLTASFRSPDSTLSSVAEPSWLSSMVQVSRSDWKLGPNVVLDVFLQAQLDTQLPTRGGRIFPTVQPALVTGSDERQVARHFYIQSLMGSVTCTFFSRLLLSTWAMVDFGDFGNAFVGGAGWRFGERTTMLLQVELSTGIRDQFFAVFKGTNNRAALVVRHEFGGP